MQRYLISAAIALALVAALATQLNAQQRDYPHCNPASVQIIVPISDMHIRLEAGQAAANKLGMRPLEARFCINDQGTYSVEAFNFGLYAETLPQIERAKQKFWNTAGWGRPIPRQ